MRSILEQAITFLLNEEQGKAETLFHKFIVERTRQIHESLRQGEEVVLAEGWDDELTSEEYFSDEDLDGVADEGEVEGDVEGVEDAVDDVDAAADDLEGDLEVPDVDADVEETDARDPSEDPHEVDDRLTDIEDQIEQLTAEFEEMMAQIDGDVDPDADVDAADLDVPDLDTDVDGDVDADLEGEDKPEGDEEAEGDEDVTKEDEDDDLDDITESVMAELEKISVSMPAGKEVGAGKTISQNNSSTLPNVAPDKRQGGKPVEVRSKNHSGYERETAPVSKNSGAGMPNDRKNVKGSAKDFQSTVPAGGDKSAMLHKDFAGGVKDTKSPVAPVKK